MLLNVNYIRCAFEIARGFRVLPPSLKYDDFFLSPPPPFRKPRLRRRSDGDVRGDDRESTRATCDTKNCVS